MQTIMCLSLIGRTSAAIARGTAMTFIPLLKSHHIAARAVHQTIGRSGIFDLASSRMGIDTLSTLVHSPKLFPGDQGKILSLASLECPFSSQKDLRPVEQGVS